MAVTPTTTNTHISDNFAKLLYPGLRKIFFETYTEVPECFSKLFKVNSSSKATETDYGLGAFKDWQIRTDEVDEVNYQKLSAGLERTYRHVPFTSGFMIGRELYDDEQYRQINKFPAALARAGRATVERDTHSLFNFGFMAPMAGYDGKALFAADHPLVDSTGVGSNLVSGALNDANLKIAIQCMGETVDEAGNLVVFVPDTLVVAPKNEFLAKELLNSAQKAGTDLNDINAIKGALKVVVDPWLATAAGGNDDAWYVMDSTKHELNFFWRVKPEFKNEEDFDTFVAKYRAYMRYSYGYSDWRGIVGSLGGLTASTAPAFTTPSASATSVTVGTCKSGAKLQLYVDGKVVAQKTASGTSESFTGIDAKLIKVGSKVTVIQTESGKAPTAAAMGTVAS